MKKYLALLAAMLFVLSFTAIAFAQTPTGTQAVVSQGDTQINLSGFIGFRGTYFKNIDLDDRSTDNSKGNGAYSEMTYGLKIDATTGKVKGVIEFYSSESGWMQFGGTDTSVSATSGNADFRDPKSGPYVRQLYIQFPVGPLTAKVGHQLLMLGVGSYVDASKEGADAIVVSYPFGKNAIGIGTVKIYEDATLTDGASNNDIDFNFVTADFDLAGHMLGINVSQLHDKVNGVVGTKTINNLGLTLKGKVGQVGYLLAGDKQSGDDAAASKNKYRGYHWRAAANFAATDMLTLSAASIYYSGEKGTATDNKVEAFQNYLENKDYATFIYGYIIRGVTGATPTYAVGTPNPAGTWFNRVAVDMKLMKDLKAQLAFINLRGTYKAISAMSYNNSSKKIGNEIDAKIDYDLAKNLTYTVQGGYFMPGKAWERADYKYDADAYAIRHMVMYSF